MASPLGPLPRRLAQSRRPAHAGRIVLLLALAVGAAAHVPAAVPLALSLGVLTVVLSSIWLTRIPASVAQVGLVLASFPYPVSRAAVAITVAAALIAVLAGRAVAELTSLMLAAQESALRQASAREELSRRTLAERDQLSTQLEEASTRDPLTGLMHRVALLQRLDLMMESGSPVGVLVLSLVGFGSVNTALGAEVGDELLAAVAQRLRSSARDSDAVGRTGGDEFSILLTGVTSESAHQVAERLPSLLHDPFTVGPHVVQLTARAGLALHDGAPDVGAAELVRHAASAARGSAGGGAAQLYDASTQARLAEQLELEVDLHRGLQNDELFLLYQPLVCTRTGRMLSVEALARWQHPERGLIPPDAFIGLAERTGLIVPLGLRVLSLAVNQLRDWAYVAPGLTVAVNVSARQLVEPGFVEQVREILWGSGIDPHNIVLELTESLLMEDEEAAVAVLWQLRGLGVRLALDDFGTGYSSLARLGNLPLDELKIDKSFVDRLGARTNDSTALVTAAVAMGHGLGLVVVAEGVETGEQAAVLSSVDCDLLQGYLMGRPQRPEDLVSQFPLRLLPPAAELPRPRNVADGSGEADVAVPRLMPDVRTG